MPAVPDEVASLDTVVAETPLEVDESRVNALQDALQRKFDMHEEDAHAVAMVVAEQFGREEEVNDDHLDPEVRSIFYTLEAKKLLTFRREEYTWENGERRRAFFWRIRDDELEKIRDFVAEDGQESVYDKLPGDVWSRHAS